VSRLDSKEKGKRKKREPNIRKKEKRE